MISLIVFIIILSILILVHEWGHFITARKCGVKVEQFALGFGPKLWSRVHDGTEFCLCAIPLGGYVKMAGDDRAKCSGNPDEFFSKSVGARALIVLMGPVVNLVLAYVCFWLMCFIGYVDMDLSAKKVEPRLGQILSGSPAEKAGLQAGDKIIAVDGKPVAHWPDMQDHIMNSTAPQLTVTFQRDGRAMARSIVPQEHKQKDIFGRVHRARRIGVGPARIKDSNEAVVVRYGFWESFPRAAKELAGITVKTYTALYEMLIGLRSPKEAMGIVGMFFVIKFALSIGFSFVLHIVGVISASLAIFNLLPVIPLDGGHLFLLALEKIRGKALSMRAEQFIARLGFALIVALALFVFYVDFERIGLVDKIIHIFKT
ncbi:MAG: site-2 protease family protein [Candidatus Omnitrophica bacterium]|nr:site-2 protease family protein [Candidatus Omnitrophota bacterium]